MLRKLNGASVNFVTLTVLVGVFFVAYQLHISQLDRHTWFMLLSIALAFSLFAAIFNYWRLLKITEAPISTIAAAAQGYIELHGVATTLKPLKTPYHGIACVWYRASVYANRTESLYSKKVVDNRLLEYSQSDVLFQLKDKTGTCMVNPNGAEIIFFEKRTFYKNDHRYVEEFLPAGKEVYVLGQLDTRHEQTDQAILHKEVGDILTDLKSHPQQMLNYYDHNRNGTIDMHEWALARQDAIEQAQAKLTMKAHTGSFTLVKPSDQHLFLISAQTPHALRKNYQIWAITHLLMFSILLLAFVKLT